MPELLLRDIPPEIYAKLQRQAEDHGWSVSHEAIDLLTTRLSEEDPTPEQLLELVRQGREKMKGVYLTDEDLEKAIREGR